MRFSEIGEQLRAYRLESGLRAEEIASLLGVSRAALYRYEKGDVIKLDTVMRLAELLKISPLSLLGIGVEYYSRPVGYFERLRQVEESVDQIIQLGRAYTYLITTSQFDTLLAEALEVWARGAGAERQTAQTTAEHLLGILMSRKKSYQRRRPTIVTVYSIDHIESLVRHGLCRGLDLPAGLRARCKEAAVVEVENLIGLLQENPMGVQLGLLEESPLGGAFNLLRGGEREVLALTPFNADGPPDGQFGAAMITRADEAISTHQRVVEYCWRRATKGQAAVKRLKSLIQASKAA
jgi:transcriptional regulator with XRE-family HTH domain